MVSHDVKLGINSVILKIFLAIFFRVLIGFLFKSYLYSASPSVLLNFLIFRDFVIV